MCLLSFVYSSDNLQKKTTFISCGLGESSYIERVNLTVRLSSVSISLCMLTSL